MSKVSRPATAAPRVGGFLSACLFYARNRARARSSAARGGSCRSIGARS